MSGEQGKGSASRKASRTHLDDFLEEKRLTPWERAVLERARKSSFYRRTSKSDVAKCKEDLFWQKLAAYECHEISKRRQKDPRNMRFEIFEKLETKRHDRLVRHGMLNDDTWAADRMKRRAERFGIRVDAKGDASLGDHDIVPIVKRRIDVLEYADTVEKLERRRARFAMEPRHDRSYRQQWKSEQVEMGATDEERMKERAKRFGVTEISHGGGGSGGNKGLTGWEDATEQVTQEWNIAEVHER